MDLFDRATSEFHNRGLSYKFPKTFVLVLCYRIFLKMWTHRISTGSRREDKKWIRLIIHKNYFL